MPYNSNLGPDQCYGVDDGGFCSVCGKHLDSDCECERCEDCDANIEDNPEVITVSVPHLKTGKLVEVGYCLGCAEKHGFVDINADATESQPPEETGKALNLSALEQGYAQFLVDDENRKLTPNPHLSNTAAFDSWYRGYNRAQQDQQSLLKSEASATREQPNLCPWDECKLATLLRFARKNCGPWDDMEGNLPEENDAGLIIELQGKAQLKLVSITQETAALAMSALKDRMEREYYSNDAAACLELDNAIHSQ